MKFSYRIFLVLLALFVVIGFMPVNPVVNAAGDETVYSDMPETYYWSGTVLRLAVSRGLIKGTSDGKILPKAKLTVLDMFSILENTFGVGIGGYETADGMNDFLSDIFDYSTDLNEYITRQQAFTMLSKALALKPADKIDISFKDINEVSNKLKGQVYAFINAGHVNGYEDGTLRPEGLLSREEAARLMYSIAKTFFNNAGVYDMVSIGNVIINTSDVTLKNVTVEGDLIIGDGVGTGKVTLDNVTVTGRTIIRGGGEHSVVFTGNSKVKDIVLLKIDGTDRVKINTGTTTGDIIIDGIFVDRAYTGNNGEGKKYKSIQEAVNKAQEGDIIYVAPGTYRENINITAEGITLKSIKSAVDTVIKANSFDVTADGVTIQGFTIDNIGGERCISPGTGKDKTIKYNIFVNSLRAIQGSYSGTCENLKIINNEFRTDYGIACTEYLNNVTIKNNLFNTKSESIGVGVGMKLSDETDDIIKFLEDNNTFGEKAGKVEDYR